MARVLVVFREGSAHAGRVRDGIDLALAALAFDHEVRVLFTGAGTALLHEEGELAANLRALSYHGATAVGADADVRVELANADHVFAC